MDKVQVMLKMAPFEPRLVWEKREFAALQSMGERRILARIVLSDLGAQVREEQGSLLGMMNPRAVPPRLLLSARLADDDQVALMLCAARTLSAEEVRRPILFWLSEGEEAPGMTAGVTQTVDMAVFDPKTSLRSCEDPDEALAWAACDVCTAALEWSGIK